MAYLVGYFTKQEQEELTRRGWNPEPYERLREEMDSSFAQQDQNHRMLGCWVDSSVFTIMSGPDWDKGEK